MPQPDPIAAHSRQSSSAATMNGPAPGENAAQGARSAEFQPRRLEEELMHALVVEDSPQIAERLVELVSIPSRVEVVATAATEDEALAACDRYTIGLAIVDLQLAQGTGFGVIRRLRAAAGTSPVCIVVLTNHAVPALKVAAFEAGADYFLDKSKDFATIPRLILELLNKRGG
jgi:DNA-binding response OmpR family regulator